VLDLSRLFGDGLIQGITILARKHEIDRAIIFRSGRAGWTKRMCETSPTAYAGDLAEIVFHRFTTHPHWWDPEANLKHDFVFYGQRIECKGMARKDAIRANYSHSVNKPGYDESTATHWMFASYQPATREMTFVGGCTHDDMLQFPIMEQGEDVTDHYTVHAQRGGKIINVLYDKLQDFHVFLEGIYAREKSKKR
jgi:hypothetical protein